MCNHDGNHSYIFCFYSNQHDFVNIQYFYVKLHTKTITCDSVCSYIHIQIYSTFTVKLQ